MRDINLSELCACGDSSKLYQYMDTFVVVTSDNRLLAAIISDCGFEPLLRYRDCLINKVAFWQHGAWTVYFWVFTFGLLPFAACFVSVIDALKYGVVGGVVFTALTWLFSAVLDRLSTGPAAKAAPILSALGLYLASQCFMGMIL